MSTIQIQKPKEITIRTEPRLPTIINKNIHVLPWDWELPSTILKSEWAKKHPQCTGAYSKYRKSKGLSFCGQGLLVHYYGWGGRTLWYGPQHTLNFREFTRNNSWNDIIAYNDSMDLTFNDIGELVEAEGF